MMMHPYPSVTYHIFSLGMECQDSWYFVTPKCHYSWHFCVVPLGTALRRSKKKSQESWQKKWLFTNNRDIWSGIRTSRIVLTFSIQIWCQDSRRKKVFLFVEKTWHVRISKCQDRDILSGFVIFLRSLGNDPKQYSLELSYLVTIHHPGIWFLICHDCSCYCIGYGNHFRWWH